MSPTKPFKLRKRARGYTAVEVLSAMTLFAIGAAGVISMQKVTIQGGVDARRFDQATNIAREWQHRLQRDAMFWTEPNSVTSNSNLNQTRWLLNTSDATTWLTPPATALPGMSGAFDILGRDISADDPDNTFFCVQYKLNWVANPGTPPKPTAIIRAEVRVFWSRLEQRPVACASPTPLPDAADAGHFYHFVYVTTALRGNPNQ